MPATSQSQANLFRLALAYKRHGVMPSGLSKATQGHIRQMAGSMSEDKLREFTHVKKSD